MILLSTLDAKSYSEDLVVEIPEISCPDPSCSGCLLRSHGWYRRYLGGARVRIRRTRCPCCSVTHALLPKDVCAYQDLTLSTLELALQAGKPGGRRSGRGRRGRGCGASCSSLAAKRGPAGSCRATARRSAGPPRPVRRGGSWKAAAIASLVVVGVPCPAGWFARPVSSRPSLLATPLHRLATSQDLPLAAFFVTRRPRF